jgi:hypothetical protein
MFMKLFIALCAVLMLCIIIGTGFGHLCSHGEDFSASLRWSLQMFSFVAVILFQYTLFVAIAVVLGVKALWPVIPSKVGPSSVLVLMSIGLAGFVGAYLAFLAGQPNPGACASP